MISYNVLTQNLLLSRPNDLYTQTPCASNRLVLQAAEDDISIVHKKWISIDERNFAFVELTKIVQRTLTFVFVLFFCFFR